MSDTAPRIVLTDMQLKDVIEQFEAAVDKRYPDAMCQVSPRAMTVALAHFHQLKADRERESAAFDSAVDARMKGANA